MINKISNKFLFLIFFLSIVFFINSSSRSIEIKIITKIDNEIITNIDVENEYKYLIALNSKLKELKREKIIGFAKNSLIKEKIKKTELLKYYKLGGKKEIVTKTIEAIYLSLNIKNETDFKEYLSTFNLKINDVYNKIEIETAWNQLIYSKYNNQITINEEEIKKDLLSNIDKQQLYNVSEIMFSYNEKNEIQKKYNEIKNSIDDIGFEKTAFLFSIAQSKNNSGLIGWVNENQVSKSIKKKIKNIQKGEITQPIIIPGAILIIKLNDVKIENKKIDLNKAIKETIKFETNRQLNNYSMIYYNKIKNNYSLDEN
jgi:peptidyl-prolyl cis-trans isomerase SurA